MLGLPPSDALRTRQKGHDAGQCLTRDRYGRVAPIAWDYLCEEIQIALDTKPKRETVVPIHSEPVVETASDEKEESA